MKLFKRITAWVMGIAIVMTTVNLPSFTLDVKAFELDEAQTPSVTAFAVKEELCDSDIFTLYQEDNTSKGVAQKVNFGGSVGSNSITWYIAGKDANGSLVLMCNPDESFGSEPFLNRDYFDISTGIAKRKFTVIDEELEVYANHYGISDVRNSLQGKYDFFSSEEIKLMLETEVSTYDPKNDLQYVTKDKLYLAQRCKDISDSNNQYIYVGSDDSGEGIKIGLHDNGPAGSPYLDNKKYFWTRTAFSTKQFGMTGNKDMAMELVSFVHNVVPAFNLDISSLLFASTAEPKKSPAVFSEENAMTFRFDGKDCMTSKAEYDNDGIRVTAGSARDEYIYVQYKAGETDKVWSENIEKDCIIRANDIGIDSLANCKVWIEKFDINTNLIYAVMATKHDNHRYIENAADDNHVCDICGASASHSFTEMDISREDTKISGATCKEPAKYYKTCKDCGAISHNNEDIYTFGAVGGHDFSDEIYYPTPDGTKHYQTCSTCDTPSEPVDHSETEVRNEKDATCTEKGYTGDTYCKDCGALIDAGKDINIIDHSWDTGKVTKEPTTDAEGEKTFTCSKCGKTRTEAIDKLPDNPTPNPNPNPTPGPDPDPTPGPDSTPGPTPDPALEVSVTGQLDVSAIVATKTDKVPVAYAVTSTDKKAAKVSKKGVVTAKKSGEIEITAYADKKKKEVIAKITIVIKKTTVPSKETISFMDDTCNLLNKITDIPGGAEVKFSIAKKQQKYATVDSQSGIVTPVKDGKAKVTIEIGKGKNVARFYTTVTVKTPKYSTSKAVKVKTGKTKTLSLKNVKSDAEIKWSISDDTTARVIEGTKPGRIKIEGLKAGTVTLIADISGHKLSKEIEILQ